MTAVLRPAMDTSPMHAISAPAPGTGKSHLVDIAAMIALGVKAPAIGATADEIEFDKRLASALFDGMPLLPLDNVMTTMASGLLAQAIERLIIKIRPLGSSTQITVPNRSLIIATGNALTIGGDNERRTILCKLDCDVERPELRHFDFDSIETVAKDRARYVRACLVLGNFGKFSKRLIEQPLASFSMWESSVRKALITLGLGDPVETMKTIREDAPDRREAATIIELLSVAFKTSTRMGRRHEPQVLSLRARGCLGRPPNSSHGVDAIPRSRG
jgi:putative DNA primase/helicase